MKVVIFCHSLVSDWNHGNAHFLRGITAELIDRGHDVTVYEPADGWSRSNLRAEAGDAPLEAFAARFPALSSITYDAERLDLEAALQGADLVLVHEWNDPALIARIGKIRARQPRMRLLFHDTHHRAVTAPEEMARFDLSCYDGVLAFGETIRQIYLQRDWARRVWTWHEAADTRVFTPLSDVRPREDLVWIGNWGDDERTAELRDYLLRPARRLGLSGSVYGVRYPRSGRWRVRLAGLRYRGWVANHRVPEIFAAHRVTVHVPRRPYVERLPGIPTIRVFEALACGIPLISAPWNDSEGLFRPGEDFLMAPDPAAMQVALARVLADADLRESLIANGRETILARHTCAHRVDELLSVLAEIGPGPGADALSSLEQSR